METFSGIIRDLSHKGFGVVNHPDGRVFFCRGTWPLDEGQFQIPLNALKYTEAKLIRLDKPSPYRVEIPCPHRGTEVGQCGGCPWMLASYESQLEFKVKRLNHALSKRKVEFEQVLKPIIPSKEVFGYRNRIQLKTTGHQLGFVSEGTSVFAPVDDCYILNPKLHKLFHDLKESLPREDFKPTGDHGWCYVDLDDEMTSSEIISNKRRPFRQGNTLQNEMMKEWLRSKLNEVPGHYPIIDLFCGSGNFTEVMVNAGFDNILAVEVQGTALNNLRKKNLQGVRVLPLDMMIKGSWAQVAKAQPHARVMLVDPPREGLDKRRGLFKYLDNLEKVIYISCELDTFSRDASDFIQQGWKLSEITPIDLFPHTPHVEIMSVFTRKTIR